MDNTFNNKQVRMLKIDDVLPNRFQPRIRFDEQALNELTSSIKAHGVIQPIIVRPLADKFEIIAGERRYKASTLAGLSEIPAIVVDMDDKESSEIALIENVQRQDLTPIEEAISYKKILDMGYLKQDELATKLGKTQSTIANKLRLLNLSDDVQDALLDGKISERHARSLLRIKDMKKQDVLLDKIISERLTVRKTDEEIERMLDNKEIEILDIDSNPSPVVEQISDPLQKFDNIYNIPNTPILEDSEDSFIPKIPDVKPLEPISAEPVVAPTIAAPIAPVVESVPTAPLTPVEALVTMPVVSDVVKPVEPLPFITPAIPEVKQEVNETPVVNPGFMDINNIEATAAPINAEPKKISLEDLLRSPNKVVNTNDTPIVAPAISEVPLTETKEEPLFNTGKFFTVVDDDKEESGENLAFKALDELKAPTANIFEANAETTPVAEAGFVLPEIGPVTPIASTPTAVAPAAPVEPVVAPAVTPAAPVEVPPTIEIAEDDENTNLEQTMAFKPIPLEGNRLSEFTMPPLDDNEVSEKVEIKPVVETTPTFDYKPLYEEPERDETPVESGTFKGGADLRTVINTIRNCGTTIEKFGYVVDLEEIDLEDSYQVTITIQKHK